MYVFSALHRRRCELIPQARRTSTSAVHDSPDPPPRGPTSGTAYPVAPAIRDALRQMESRGLPWFIAAADPGGPPPTVEACARELFSCGLCVAVFYRLRNGGTARDWGRVGG